MQKIVFFDIDQTVFNVDLFIQNFNSTLISRFGLSDTDLDEVKQIYKGVKEEYGYFVPNVYLELIHDSFSKASKDELKLAFWNNINSCLFSDSEVIGQISEIAKVGFFSKGDEEFQKKKIGSFMDFTDQNYVYIFPEKIDKISEVFGKYADSRCYLVDDSLDVLEMTKAYNANIRTILIDRGDKVIQNNYVDFKIRSLSDIMPILNE